MIEKRRKKNQGTLPPEKKPQVQLSVKEMMKKFENTKKEEPVEKEESKVKKMVVEWNEKDRKKDDKRAGGARKKRYVTCQDVDQQPTERKTDDENILRKIPTPRNIILNTHPMKEKDGNVAGGSEENRLKIRNLEHGLRIASGEKSWNDVRALESNSVLYDFSTDEDVIT